MLRPLLAFLTLCLAAFLLAPTVASVHDRVTDLSIERDMPWEIWKWTDEPQPQLLPDCGREKRHTVSEVTHFPTKIDKDDDFTLRGWVGIEEEGGAGADGIEVDLFLNETKSEPGVLLGTTTTRHGYFQLETEFPREMRASHYHIVAHAKEKLADCKHYLEHWSDPEMDVVSDTSFEWEPVEHAVIGRNVTITGRLVDVVGAAVEGANVTVVLAGEARTVQTTIGGRFSIEHTPEKVGNLTIKASYEGSEYYHASTGEHTIPVATEAFVLGDDADSVRFVRSEAQTISGQVFVRDSARTDEVTLSFAGTRIALCPTCEPETTLQVPVDANGSFSIQLLVPPTEVPGEATLSVTGGGLQEAHTRAVRVVVQPVVTLDAHGASLFGKKWEATTRLTDELGRPLVGPIAFLGPDGWNETYTDENGTVAIAAASPCGRYHSEAHFNGTRTLREAAVSDDMVVCTYLAAFPPWLAVVPLWVWPLLLVALALGGWLAWSLRQTYAPVIRSGPPLALLFTEPGDDAVGYAGIGEPVVATAFLEQPLPDGHALRMGTSRHTHEVPLDADLRAQLRILPEKLGDIPVRAEIVDGKGRVVSRRTAILRVVRYGEEIERRYLALRAGSGAHEAVTPREFERWLHARAPGLDPAVARRLIHVFEEADYSPRTAGRAEFAAYLAAEKGVTEVTVDATLA